MSAPEIIERGERICWVCGFAHDLRDSDSGTTWADPDDGHIYCPIEWDDLARRLASVLKEVASGPCSAAVWTARRLWEPLTREEATP